jgi:hypothetical protein
MEANYTFAASPSLVAADTAQIHSPDAPSAVTELPADRPWNCGEGNRMTVTSQGLRWRGVEEC